MPTNSPNQGITTPVDADPADAPANFLTFLGGFENRLVQRFTNDADRTTRRPAPTENELSALTSEDFFDVYNSAAWVSLHTRAIRQVRMNTDQGLTVSNTTLQNITSLVIPVNASGNFQFDLVLFFDGPTGGDIKFAITGPAGASGWYGGHGPATTVAANVGDGVWGVATALGNSITYGTSGAGTGNSSIVRITGTAETAGTAGNLQVQAAQNTSDAGTTTVRARSRFHVWRIS